MMITLELASESFVMGTLARLQSNSLPAFLVVVRLHQGVEEQTLKNCNYSLSWFWVILILSSYE